MGVILIGAFVMVYLFGIVTVQTYRYYRKYTGDFLGLKVMVASVWILLLGHLISAAIGVYTIAVLNFGQISVEDLVTLPMPMGFASSILFSALPAPITQGYFAYRIHVISKRIYIPALSWLVSLMRLIGSFAIGSHVIKNKNSLQTVLAEFPWLVEGIFMLGAVGDTLIALTMCYYLKHERSSALAPTAKILNRLMRYTIETGSLTSVVGLTVVICFKTMDNLAWFGMYLIVAEVYANTLLANLNARKPHPNNDEKDHGSPHLTFLANIEARNSRFERGLARLGPQRSSKDGTGSGTPDYTRDGMSLTPSTPPEHGIVIEVCQTKLVVRDAHEASEEHMHSVGSFV
ncbi:hypothetical protein BJ138DRAFT_1116942 [Hygrophoropsis aurantiaca]|uniref:Uncharacterized protein n=1 Tax=Hygrophoropsis aurantiaca TaxID=72124 RepID=A0ACB8A350_9AGAM|nr:hypothetical protein BJ138DRAFT_1116942 [Hygrophoropsis aurantiaca]